MVKSIAFIIYYHRSNRNSFNALLGALETDKISEDIAIFYAKNENEVFNYLEEIIKNFETVILGISLFTTQLWETFNLIKSINNRYGKKLIKIAGGPHPSGDPKGTLALGFDVVFIGEGEESLIEFLTKVSLNESYTKIKGISFIDEEGTYYNTGKRTLLDLNKYAPFPAKTFIFGAIEITRGCPYFCYFCQTPYLLGSKPRHRSIESICEYIQLMKDYGLSDIRFITPNAFSYGSSDGKSLNLSKLKELLVKITQVIAPKGRIFLGSFPSEVRPEHVTPETLNLILEYCSNDNITIGAQSGSQRVLDLCHRGHTVEDIYNAVTLTIEHGLKANIDFIFGLPDENENDIALTIEMMKQISKLGARIHTHSFIPLPQTPFSTKEAHTINDEIKKAVIGLISNGKAFGEWRKQEKLAIKITQYLKTRKIEENGE